MIPRTRAAESRADLIRQPDALLCALARRGSEAAFAAIVARYRSPLERHCAHFLPPERAEDAVQKTFVRAWRALAAGTDVQELRPWLYRIAGNVALDERAIPGWDHEQLDQAAMDQMVLDDEFERRVRLREALASVAALPVRQREALLRSVVDGATPAAIGRELGVSEGAVRQLIHRARLTLRAGGAAVVPGWLARGVGRIGHSVHRVGSVAGGSATGPVAMTPVAGKVVGAIAVAAVIAAPVKVVTSTASASPSRPVVVVDRGESSGGARSGEARKLARSASAGGVRARVGALRIPPSQSAAAPSVAASAPAQLAPPAAGSAAAGTGGATGTSAGATSATHASATDGSATDASATHASATDASATDASATDASATDASATDASATEASAAAAGTADPGPMDLGATTEPGATDSTTAPDAGTATDPGTTIGTGTTTSPGAASDPSTTSGPGSTDAGSTTDPGPTTSGTTIPAPTGSPASTPPA